MLFILIGQRSLKMTCVIKVHSLRRGGGDLSNTSSSIYLYQNVPLGSSLVDIIITRKLLLPCFMVL